MKTRLKDNLSYKFVALGVALILWISMLGRKDGTVTKDFELRLMLQPSLELQQPPKVPPTVKVEVTGPRVALKKINQMSSVFTVDLTDARPGRQVVELSKDGLNLPIGARVQSIEPSEFTIELRQVGAKGEAFASPKGEK